uniref:Reverse transcriptase n=1 Tax=Cannabis sativa TaxID=3483 RepID=A0A803QGY6_CANSA
MKAQLRKKNYLIGAQLLKLGNEEALPRTGGVSRRSDAKNPTVDATKIMEIDSMISGSNGGTIKIGDNRQGSNEDDRWLDMFPTVKLFDFEVSTSDHCPLLLVPVNTSALAGRRVFRFENSWLREPLCLKVVKDTWAQAVGSPIMDKVKNCGEVLLEWGKDYTGNFKKRIQECKVEICHWKKGRDTVAVSNYKAAHINLNNILLQRKIFWKQRSKQLWLREGDQNSKIFHAKATSRRRNNLIQKLKNNVGVWVGWEDELPTVVADYFNQLFNYEAMEYRVVVECIQLKITEEQNEQMLGDVTVEEIKKKALFQMHPEKSLGLDGMTPGFY